MCRLVTGMFAVMVYALNLCHLTFDVIEKLYELRSEVRFKIVSIRINYPIP
jgi:hypothetical protein